MIHEIEEEESDLEECNLISPKKEIKEEIQEIRNKLLLSLNLWSTGTCHIMIKLSVFMITVLHIFVW